MERRVERETEQLEAEMTRLLIPDAPMEEERDDHDYHKEERGDEDEEYVGMIGRLQKFSMEGTYAERLRRQTRRVNDALTVDVFEVLGPPRVNSEGKNSGFRTRVAMDLLTGWEFNKAADWKRVRDYIARQKPRLIVGSPY